MTGGCLMQNERNAESTLESFLHNFHFTLSDPLSTKIHSLIFQWPFNTGLIVNQEVIDQLSMAALLSGTLIFQTCRLHIPKVCTKLY